MDDHLKSTWVGDDIMRIRKTAAVDGSLSMT